VKQHITPTAVAISIHFLLLDAHYMYLVFGIRWSRLQTMIWLSPMLQLDGYTN